MKFHITSDFLRGILFAFVAQQCCTFSVALIYEIRHSADPVQLAYQSLMVLAFLLLLLGLLLRPERVAGAGFIFLLLFSLLPVVSALYWLIRDPVVVLRSLGFTISLLPPLVVATVAYYYYRDCVQHKQA